MSGTQNHTEFCIEALFLIILLKALSYGVANVLLLFLIIDVIYVLSLDASLNEQDEKGKGIIKLK